MDSLAKFTELEVLHASDILREFDSAEIISDRLRPLVTRCPRLRRVTMFGSSEVDLACEIVREDEKMTWSILGLYSQKSASFYI
jgi:hypothetical protein